MPKYSAQPQWRQRQDATRKKGKIDAQMLMDSEIIIPSKMMVEKPPSSPTSVAFMFNDSPEIKPMTLPGTWITVGKKGKPMKDSKMYDEPKQKAKNHRKRARKPASDDAPLVVKLDEVPSSSKCHQMLERVSAKREKETMRMRDAKYWVYYRKEKEFMRLARDQLVAALFEDGVAPDETASTKPLKVKYSCKANTHAEKTRRKVRHAAMADRCYSLESDADEIMEPPQVEVEVKQPARWPRQIAQRRTRILPGRNTWITVGKKGKLMYMLKKTHRKRARKPASDDAPLVVKLDEVPSSSKCHQMLERVSAKREKKVMRAQDAKYWVHYRQGRETMRLARDELIASGFEDGVAPDETASTKPLKVKYSCKANTHAEKTRRKVRHAAMADRCY